MYGFTLNHQLTSVSLGLRFAEPVELPTSTRMADDIKVDGRAGTLTRFAGWKDVQIKLELAVDTRDGLGLYRRAVLELIRAVTISFTGESDVYRHVKYCDVSGLRRNLSGWGFFTAELTCQPFTYLKTGLKPVEITKPQLLVNPGLLPADPVITFYGTGELKLQVAGEEYRVVSPVDRVTVDSSRLVAHASGRVQTDAVTGGFPVFKPGPNRIGFGKEISKLVITPNWRNL